MRSHGREEKADHDHDHVHVNVHVDVHVVVDRLMRLELGVSPAPP